MLSSIQIHLNTNITWNVNMLYIYITIILSTNGTLIISSGIHYIQLRIHFLYINALKTYNLYMIIIIIFIIKI